MSLHLDPGVLGAKLRNRDDLRQTSTGQGHDFTNGFYFPPSLYRRTLKDVLPPPKTVLDRVTWRNQVMTNYETTKDYFHDRKNFGSAPYSYPIHKQAATSSNVHYIKDLHEKLQSTDSRRAPLTMGYQSSEMTAQYQRKDPRSYRLRSEHAVQPYNLSHHHSGGASQQVIASTQNPALRGKEYFANDQGTFKLNEAYLTTGLKTHRHFTKDELLGHPKKEAATFWECENYTKVWGHGSKENPMINDTKIILKHQAMRDPAFKSNANVQFLPKVVNNVPHTGMKTLAQDSYRVPAHPGNRSNLYCPIDQTYVTPTAGPVEVMTAPKMYKSEYTTYGSGRPVTISSGH